MKTTFFLFLHQGEPESLIPDLAGRVRNLPRRSAGAEHALILSFQPVPVIEGWPHAYRCVTNGLDPELVVREVHATQWMHQARLMYRTEEDPAWSFLTVEWKETDQWGETSRDSSSS